MWIEVQENEGPKLWVNMDRVDTITDRGGKAVLQYNSEAITLNESANDVMNLIAQEQERLAGINRR